MRLFQEAGIYVLVILNLRSMNSDIRDGRRYPRWDYTYYKFLTHVVDNFQGYSNTLGFILDLNDDMTRGIELVSLEKTAVRDLKEYIKSKTYRRIPIGATGFSYNPSTVTEFLNCGNSGSSIDFYGIKHYFKSTTSLPYYEILEDYRNYSLPLFFYYDGSTKKDPEFAEVQDIYANSITAVFSGGIVRDWYHEPVTQGMSGEYSVCLKPFLQPSTDLC
jgi:hypothetical protein